MFGIRRREFITLLGGAAAVWPLAARASRPEMPVIGFLGAHRRGRCSIVAAFRQGLPNRSIRGPQRCDRVSLGGRSKRSAAGAGAELVRRQVAVIVATGGTAAAFAAKAATTTIPIVFSVSGRSGQHSASSPASTGRAATSPASASSCRVGGKATRAAARAGSGRDAYWRCWSIRTIPLSQAQTSDVQAAARASARQSTSSAPAQTRDRRGFRNLVRKRADALLVGTDPFLYSRRDQLATLAARHAIPAIYPVREYAEAGGLMSYGTSLTDAFRQVGVYTGRILKGEKPADLPVVQPTKFELVINLQDRQGARPRVPPALLARADEVIE